MTETCPCLPLHCQVGSDADPGFGCEFDVEHLEIAQEADPASSVAERRAAAAEILRATPMRSDREVGKAVGLSAGTVSAVRRTLGERRASHLRVGADGRVRPVNAHEGRRAAARLLAEHPEIPVRAMAREAGISLGTAHDVRRRVLAGLPPVPEGRAGSQPGQPQAGVYNVPQSPNPARRTPRSDPAAALDALRRDPVLRYSDTGRTILRRLDAQLLAASQLIELCEHVPAHCGTQVEAVLRHIGAACEDAVRAVHGRVPTRSNDEFDG
ncbi:hypothetical protein [Catenulispora rubra]|uniref:hypothetical protein n=1 Tax=Catenulispora rubra TaxID=280293 RepID=UPI001892388C|nr:hypothetical protein [Catenulispora rubra]